MKNWVWVFHKADFAHLGSVRCWPNLLAAETAAEIWLRVPIRQAELEHAFRVLPAWRTYQEDAQGLLFPLGQKTPERNLPLLNWVPIADYIPVEMPLAALPAPLEQQYTLKLVPSAVYRPGAALKLSWAVWQQYAETAPAIRLEALQFALADKGEVLVLGTPLPPLQGEELWRSDDVLLPSAYDVEWPIVVHLLQQKENAQGTFLLLFDQNGNWQKIAKDCLVKASRSGIRGSKPRI
jgi:hypothetical protein